MSVWRDRIRTVISDWVLEEYNEEWLVPPEHWHEVKQSMLHLAELLDKDE